MNKKIQNIIYGFTPISLEETDGVSLMKRTDTKFVIHEKQLLEVLNVLGDSYKVLEINEKRIMRYSSLYFDTESCKFYNDHHNGKVNRTKIRIRKYVDSNLCFLEVKQKNGKGDTEKSRMEIDDFETNLSTTSQEFISSVTHQHFALKPIIWNKFKRITLVNKKAGERLTIDLNLLFKNDESKKKFRDLVIVEVKQTRINRNSPVIQVLKESGITPYRISKYCIGIISLYKQVKYNNFKRKQLKINSILA